MYPFVVSELAPRKLMSLLKTPGARARSQIYRSLFLSNRRDFNCKINRPTHSPPIRSRNHSTLFVLPLKELTRPFCVTKSGSAIQSISLSNRSRIGAPNGGTDPSLLFQKLNLKTNPLAYLVKVLPASTSIWRIV